MSVPAQTSAPRQGESERDPLTVRVRDLGFWADWASAVGLLVLVVIFSIASPTFLTLGNIEALLSSAAILLVLVVGQSFVIATAGIDLSVASNMTFGAAMLGWAYGNGWGIAVACLVAIAASGAFGLVNGLVVAKGKVTDFLVTLGSLSAASGAALIVSDGKPQQVISGFMLQLTSGALGPLPYTVLIALAVAAIAHVVLFRSRFGLHLMATGGERESARAMGVKTDRVKIAVYTFSGLCAGLAAILLVARVGSAEPTVNFTYLLNSVAAVVLGGVSLFGGRGTIAGPVVGALLLTALVNGLTLLGVSQFYQPLAVGIIVVLAALLMRFQR